MAGGDDRRWLWFWPPLCRVQRPGRRGRHRSPAAASDPRRARRHAAECENAYRWVDPARLARSLPGLAEVGGPALVAAMGDPARFARGKQFRAFTGLTPRASETGDTDRKGPTNVQSRLVTVALDRGPRR